MKLYALALSLLVLLGAGTSSRYRLARVGYHTIALFVAGVGLALTFAIVDGAHAPLILRDPALAAAIPFLVWGLLFAAFGLETYGQTVTLGIYGAVHGTIAGSLGALAGAIAPTAVAGLASWAASLTFLMWSAMTAHFVPATLHPNRQSLARGIVFLLSAGFAFA